MTASDDSLRPNAAMVLTRGPTGIVLLLPVSPFPAAPGALRSSRPEAKAPDTAHPDHSSYLGRRKGKPSHDMSPRSWPCMARKLFARHRPPALIDKYMDIPA